MPNFPKVLFKKERRPKPAKPDTTTPALADKFVEANEKAVKHLHPGDPGFETDLGLLALNEIFTWIRNEAAERLDKVNQGIAHFNETGTMGKYNTAVQEFEAWLKALNDPKPLPTGSGSFGPTINAANVEPIREVGGYYTAARVVVQWLGGTHSDSSVVHVP